MKLAPTDKLKREIQAVLDPKLISGGHRSGFGKFDGHAYSAAEAYFHLTGGADSGLQPMQLKRRGKSHWWLVNSDGRVIDMVLGPRETSKFPYEKGAKRPFRYTPAGISKAGQAVVDRVLDTRG
jgi:hypothetical protein